VGGIVEGDDASTTWFTKDRIIDHLAAKEQRTLSAEDDAKQLEECGFDVVELEQAGQAWANNMLEDADVGEEDKSILVAFISAAFTMGLETGVNLERQKQLGEMFNYG
jgi:hypothetical protein